MVIDAPGRPLRMTTGPILNPTGTDVLIRVAACAVCRTDLHVADGEITALYPIVPGDEIIGRVIAIGSDLADIAVGDRVGVAWLERSSSSLRR
jgi:propanol-preferring alcohol dehydrogenase